MSLKTLKPQLQAINTTRIKMLETTAGATPRMKGRAWMKERQTALVAGLFACVDCGRVSATNEIDHDTPLEQGGANHQSNYRVRCIECHKAKSKRESDARQGKR